MCLITPVMKGSLRIYIFFYKQVKAGKKKMSTSKKWDILGDFLLLESAGLPVSALCNRHLWVCVMAPRALEGGWWFEGRCWSFGGTWWSTKPSVHCLRSKTSLYPLHLSPWEWHICDNVTSHTLPENTPAAPSWETAHRRFIWLSLWWRKHTSDQGVSTAHCKRKADDFYWLGSHLFSGPW